MPHCAAVMNPKINFNNVVKPRIHGRSAIRIKKLAEKTGMSESQVSNRAIDAGIQSVEKQFRNVVKMPSE